MDRVHYWYLGSSGVNGIASFYYSSLLVRTQTKKVSYFFIQLSVMLCTVFYACRLWLLPEVHNGYVTEETDHEDCALYDTETNYKQDEQVENSGANGTSMDQEVPMMENVVHDTPHNQIRLVSENGANETEANEVPIYQNIAGI